MEFCLALSHHPWARAKDPATAARATVETIKAADSAGLESVWLSEDPDGWDAFAVLGAAALETSRIRLGTGVTNPYVRHPNLLAMSLVTLDRLSGGRAFLGLGRGQPEWYRHALGVETGNPVAALSDEIDLLRQWWRAPHRASISGQFHIRDWAHALGPVQPHLPIYLAALGPRALTLAVEQANGVLISEFASLPFLATLTSSIRARLIKAGRDPDAFRFYVRTAIEVTEDPEPALARRKNLMALVNALPGMAQHISVPGYDVDRIMAEVRAAMRTEEVLARGGGFIDLRRAGDFAAARRAIPTELVEAVSYVGSAARIREKLRALGDIGVTHVFLAPLKSPDPAAYADLIASIQP